MNKEIEPGVMDAAALIVYIPGCPPKPEAMIAGLARALKDL